MKLTPTLLLTLTTLPLSLATPTPASSPSNSTNLTSWAGANNYFLPGLSSTSQDTYIRTLASYGTKVVRIWINSQPSAGTCVKGSVIATSVPQLETKIGTYNDQTLAAVDTVLYKLHAAGLKAIISIHDANLLPSTAGGSGPNGVDVYGTTYGTAANFYTNASAARAFDARIGHVLNYNSPTFKKPWKDLGMAILAFDIQNEPFATATSICSNSSSANTWLCDRAHTIRSILTPTSPIQISTGGIGGDISHNCNFWTPALNCPSIDLIAVHRYAGTEASDQANWANAAASWFKTVGEKKVYVEEWGIDGSKANQTSEWPANTDDLDKGGIPWVYWEILPEKECSVADSDYYGIALNETGGNGTVSGEALRAAFGKADGAAARQDWRGLVG